MKIKVFCPLPLCKWLLSRICLRFLCFGTSTFQLSTMKNKAEPVCQSTRCKTAWCLAQLSGTRRSKLLSVHESNAFASWEMLAKVSPHPLRVNCFGLHAPKALYSMKNNNLKRNVHVEASRRICHLIICKQLRAGWRWEEKFLFWNDRAGGRAK